MSEKRKEKKRLFHLKKEAYLPDLRDQTYDPVRAYPKSLFLTHLTMKSGLPGCVM